jgi:hypothetical protein
MKTLALNGGGVLGYAQALILSELESRAGKPCAEVFGLIGGTSVGSIIGAALAVGVPSKTIENFFVEEAPKIFSGSWWGRISPPMYNAKNLEAALFTMLGDATLSGCSTRLIVPAFDFQSGMPVYFDSGRKSVVESDRTIIGNDSPIQLWQICRASSAAQGYFGGFRFGPYVFIDGGNTGDNAPDMAIVERLVVEGVNLGQVKMLSIGNGEGRWDGRGNDMVSPGWLAVAKNTIKTTFAAGEDVQVARAAAILGGGHYRLMDAGLAQAIDDASPEALKAIRKAANGELAAQGGVLEAFVG